MLWVFGFGKPKAPDACRDRGDGAETIAVKSVDNRFPVRLGLDLYVVDFCDPTDFIERNAPVVDRLITERISTRSWRSRSRI